MAEPRAASLAGAVSAMLDRLAEESVCMHGFSLIRDGQAVAEGSWAPMRESAPHRMFSVSKSMTSLAIGLLLADGRLQLTDEICDFFPDKLPAKVPGPLRRLTIRDMLRMATCHRETTYKRVNDPDWTRSFFTVPPTHEPGTAFHYDTSSSHTLAALVERLSGMAILKFLQRRLYDRLGATDEKRWLKDPVGVSQGGTGLIMTLRDLGKIAAFCVTLGVGTPLEAYLREAVKKQIDTPRLGKPEERYGYGYQFWRVRHGGFAMYGLGGQLAVCLPEQNAAFCTTADTQLDPNGVQKIFDAFFETVFPALSGGRDSTVGEWERLGEKLQTLRVKPVPNDAGFAAPLGREYVLDQNPAGISYVCLKDKELVFDNAAGRHTLPFSTGDWAASTFPDSNEPCIASAGWVSAGVLRLLCHLIGDEPCGVEFILRFSGDAVTVEMRSVRSLFTEGYTGTAAGTALK